MIEKLNTLGTKTDVLVQVNISTLVQDIYNKVNELVEEVNRITLDKDFTISQLRHDVQFQKNLRNAQSPEIQGGPSQKTASEAQKDVDEAIEKLEKRIAVLEVKDHYITITPPEYPFSTNGGHDNKTLSEIQNSKCCCHRPVCPNYNKMWCNGERECGDYLPESKVVK
jgi:hypothetical protein